MDYSEALPAPSGDPSRQLRIAEQQRLPQAYVPGAPGAPSAQADDDVIDLREIWRTLMRRKGTIALVTVLAVALALIATFNATPIYKGSVLLQIDRTSNQVVEYGNVMQEDAGLARDQEFYATQYELLRSRSLARRVIDQVGLRTIEEEPSLVDDAKGLVKGLLNGVTGRAGDEEAVSRVDPEIAERKKEEDLFLAHLTVSPVRNSRLVRIEYDSPYPQEAAAVANAVANNFININLERRYDASSYAKQFLEEQLLQMRATLEDSEKRFVAYAREREIVNLDDRLEILLNKLREMNTELVTVEAERIEAEAEYQEMLEARQGGSPGVLESRVIQSLKERRGDLQAEYQEKLRTFKPGYPDMVQLQSRINELSGEIARETASISEGLKARFQAKVREEVQLRLRIQEVKNDALALQDRSTDYETLKREVETNRELYDGLLQRMKEVGVAAGVGENNVSVVDAAQVPPQPYKPSLAMNLAIALALGLFLGTGLAFLLETLDDTIKSSDEVERHIGAPVLSEMPFFSIREVGLTDDEAPLIAFRDPKSAVAEAARSLRTSLLFSTAEGAPRIIHFTSAWPRRGQDDHIGQHCGGLRTGGRQGAHDRCGPAQPVAAPGVLAAERRRPDQSPGR